MLKKLTIYPVFLVFLSACQTHFPIVTEPEPQACNEPIASIELSDIDYLLFANQMIDTMIQDRNIQQRISNKRMTLKLLPIENRTNEMIDLSKINLTLKNRLLRSGHFIINDSTSEPLQLSGAFENINTSSNACAESYGRFSLQLQNSQTGQILWSGNRKFN